jgi:hypothetical protein
MSAPANYTEIFDELVRYVAQFDPRFFNYTHSGHRFW